MVREACSLERKPAQYFAASLLSTAHFPLPLILLLDVGNGLPLHVARMAFAPAGERPYVVNHLASVRPLSRHIGKAGVRQLEIDFG